MSYELGWRRLSDPGRTASRAVLGQLGDRLLSAVKYVRRADTFDNPIYPTQGVGLGGAGWCELVPCALLSVTLQVQRGLSMCTCLLPCQDSA